MCNYREKFRENRATIVVVLTLVGPPLSGDQNLFETILWKWWRVNRWNIVIIIHQKLHTVHLFQFRNVCYILQTNRCYPAVKKRFFSGHVQRIFLSQDYLKTNFVFTNGTCYSVIHAPCTILVLSALYTRYLFYRWAENNYVLSMMIQVIFWADRY